jgi:anti-sigma factor RsiW
MSKLPVSEDDLHAWVDGQLVPERRLAFEQAMARDPALAARATDIERQNAWLRDGLDGLLHEPLPQRLIDAARMRPQRPRVRGWVVPAATAAAMLVVGMATGWYARDAALERSGTPTTFARQAALTHAL